MLKTGSLMTQSTKSIDFFFQMKTALDLYINLTFNTGKVLPLYHKEVAVAFLVFYLEDLHNSYHRI